MPSDPPVPRTAPHHLRDLDRRGRLWALAFAAALVLAPVQAYLHVVADWLPAGDPARIAIQTLDVGTARTPLTGQPSTSADYVDADRHVDHLGPLHNYLMAGPVRVLGVHTGMLATSVVIMSTCALLSAWAAFRRLGPTGGVVAAVVIGLTMFTTGASSLTVPISSNIAGYPLFSAAVLLWCVLRGDLRLLPLAAAMTTFAAQQHLSVVPSVAVLVPAALGGLLWHWGRGGRWRTPEARRHLALWSGAAAFVSLLLWSPMLLQEATGDPGNLTALAELSTDGDRPTLGPRAAVRQVTNVLGLPPELGRTDLDGLSGLLFLQPVPLGTALSAVAVVGLLGLLARHWRRRQDPERLSLVTMTGVLAVAGLVNGATALDGVEAARLVFFHWVWPLTFFVTVALTLGAVELLRHARPERATRIRERLPRRTAAMTRPALLGVALLVVAVPAVVNPMLDRPSNELRNFRSPVERRYIEDLTAQVLEHRDRLDGPFPVIQQGRLRFTSVRGSLVLSLIDRGADARLPDSERFYVADNRIAWPDEVDGNGGLLVVQDFTTDWREVGEGELIADVLTVDEDLPAAVRDLETDLAGGGPVVFGPGIRAGLDRLPDTWVDLAEQGRLAEVEDEAVKHLLALDPEEVSQTRLLFDLDAAHDDPSELVESSEAVNFLLDHPPESPRIRPTTLERLGDSLPDGELTPGRPLRMRVYLLDQEEVDRR